MKPIREKLVDREEIQEAEPLLYGIEREVVNSFENLSPDELTPRDRKNMTMKLNKTELKAAPML